MDERGEQRGRKAKACDRVGRHRLQLARHHRIGRPHEGGEEGRGQTGDLAGRESPARIAGEQQHRAGEPEQRADDVMRRQPLARQQRREQHDQQRPEIIQQAGFGRRRKAQREEIQRVIAEQPADADHPGDQWLLHCAEGGRPEQEACERHRGADPERHGGELERGNFPGGDRQNRQQRPHQDRGQSDQCGGTGSHWQILVMAEHSAKRVVTLPCPAIHVFLAAWFEKTWMPGTSPGMTTFYDAFCATALQ